MRWLAVLAASLLVASLAGCVTAPPAPTIDSTEAKAQYQPAMDDLVEALESAYPTVDWTTDPDHGDRVLFGSSDEPCSLWLADQLAESLPDASGGWDNVMTVVNPVLETHGFSAISETDDIAGGFTGISSTDDAGSEFRIVDKAGTNISLEIDVTDTSCKD